MKTTGNLTDMDGGFVSRLTPNIFNLRLIYQDRNKIKLQGNTNRFNFYIVATWRPYYNNFGHRNIYSIVFPYQNKFQGRWEHEASPDMINLTSQLSWYLEDVLNG